MTKRNDYEFSMRLVREAENLIKESQSLLNDLNRIRDTRDYDKEIRALREKILKLEMQNNYLYIENVYLKSKVKEIAIVNDKKNAYQPLLTGYKISK